MCAHSIRLSHQQKSFATPASSFLYFIEYLSKLFEVGTGQNKNWDGASTRSLQTGRAACKACIAALSLVQSRKAFWTCLHISCKKHGGVVAACKYATEARCAGDISNLVAAVANGPAAGMATISVARFGDVKRGMHRYGDVLVLSTNGCYVEMMEAHMTYMASQLWVCPRIALTTQTQPMSYCMSPPRDEGGFVADFFPQCTQRWGICRAVKPKSQACWHAARAGTENSLYINTYTGYSTRN